jgi:metal-responsive CopG/Arc/MetJ family transcriptional regulator
MMNFRAPLNLINSLDTWIASQPDPKPSRSEAIRRLIEKALKENKTV